jgi:hypothetical protein
MLSQASYYSHDDLRLHFGLGAAEHADAIEIKWPNGAVETLGDVRANQLITIREGAGLRPNPQH